MIELKSGTRIWIAAGFTDLRRGLQWLSSIVETVFEQAPAGLSGEAMSGGGFQRVGKPAAPFEFTLGDGGQVGLLPGDQAGKSSHENGQHGRLGAVSPLTVRRARPESHDC